ncbi:MAG TPA: GWxTD domain-containing protein [Thermoanaerobaculia bacterium]|nr:GWxTD domain-containing protein [Thermoanaerobaculia bacterium]
MKSSSSCSRPDPISSRSVASRRRLRWCAPLLLSGLVASVAGGQDDRTLELTNPFLGPRYAQFLVGALGEIATEEERREYLLLEEDEAAQRFIDEFWQGRGPQRQVYEQRAEEADKRFTEGTVPGRRTDRGAIYILYGDPEETEYEQHRDIDDPPVELWRYPKKAAPGLDGEEPQRIYRFIRWGEVTVRFQKGDPNDPDVRRRRRPDPLRPPPY